MFDVLDRQGIRELFRQRWPEPIGATIYCRAPFNAFPRLPIQVAAYLNRVAVFGARQLPRQGSAYLLKARSKRRPRQR